MGRAVRFLPIALLVVAFTGCRSSSSAAPDDAGPVDSGAGSGRMASCDRSSALGTCSEYDPAWVAKNDTSLTASCTRGGGLYAYGDCPNTSIVGSCRIAQSESRKYYGSGSSPYDADRARKDCETIFHGVWTPR